MCHITNACVFAINPQGKYASAGVWGDSRRRTGLPRLWRPLEWPYKPVHLNPWGTDVPLITPNQQCATSHHFGNAGYRPTANISSFDPKGVRDASTPHWHKTAVLLLWSGSIYTQTRWRGHTGTRCHSQRATSPKVEGGEACGEALQKELPRGLLQRVRAHQRGQASIPQDPPAQLWAWEVILSLPIFREMATSANLIGSEVHEVKEVWTGQKDLWATYHAAKSSPQDIHFFRVMLPTESPRIIGLRGSIPQRPCISGVGCPSVHGAEKKGRMRVLQ